MVIALCTQNLTTLWPTNCDCPDSSQRPLPPISPAGIMMTGALVRDRKLPIRRRGCTLRAKTRTNERDEDDSPTSLHGKTYVVPLPSPGLSSPHPAWTTRPCWITRRHVQRASRHQQQYCPTLSVQPMSSEEHKVRTRDKWVDCVYVVWRQVGHHHRTWVLACLLACSLTL